MKYYVGQKIMYIGDECIKRNCSQGAAKDIGKTGHILGVRGDHVDIHLDNSDNNNKHKSNPLNCITWSTEVYRIKPIAEKGQLLFNFMCD